MSAPLLALPLDDGRALVYQRPAVEGNPVAHALLRAGVPRGTECPETWDIERAEGLVHGVDNVDTWYRTGRELRCWAREGRWGLVDGVPFDRGQVRAACRVHGWTITDTQQWTTVEQNGGRCLVLRGARGRRLLVMSGGELARLELGGRVLRDGARVHGLVGRALRWVRQ